MNSLPWRFWINFSLAVGLGPALGVGAGVSASTRSIWMGLFFGLLSGIVFVAGAASFYQRAMRRRIPGFTLRDANMRQEATIEIPVDGADAFDLCSEALNALPGFFATKSDAAAGVLEGLTGGGVAAYWSFGAPGEKLEAQIESIGHSSRVKLLSRPGTLFVVLDFGKNKKNIDSISNYISGALRRRIDNANDAAERAEMQRALTAAKLSVLRSQIEPHFLYNTLANAQSLTRTDPKKAEDMLGHLIAFLRAAAQDSDAQSTIGQELDRVAAYLEIMKIRMGDRLQYSINLADALREEAFPPLMLQTLVENAIKHGLEPKVGGGTISINVLRSGESLTVSVADNGVGLSGGTAGTGIGLKNIRERLALLYKDRATLALAPGASSGMTATIVLPAEHPTQPGTE